MIVFLFLKSKAVFELPLLIHNWYDLEVDLDNETFNQISLSSHSLLIVTVYTFSFGSTLSRYHNVKIESHYNYHYQHHHTRGCGKQIIKIIKQYNCKYYN
ncbi:hypothetical protein ACTFIZ_009728 [Dictyostelium cf. discoideum]